jgi:hypothetical protein
MSFIHRIHRAFTSILGPIILIAQLVSAQSPKVQSATHDYPTLGNPTSAVATRDGSYVFVSVTNVGAPNFNGSDAAAGSRKDAVSGIEVFRNTEPASSHATLLKSVGFVRTGSTGANGLALLPGERTLVVGVGDDGVAFLDVKELISDSAKVLLAGQGNAAGTFDVVATPDGRFVFSSNEYGIVNGQRGNVGITEVHTDASGRVTHAQSIGAIAAGDVVPSLTLSPDGTRLYVATELVPVKDAPRIAGAANPTLTKHDCVQRKDTPPASNGFLTVIDVQRAVHSQGNAVLSRVAAGCSPVRIVETADSSSLYASARGDDVILAFNPRQLESDPEHAFLRAIPSGGTAPVGMRLFGRDQLLAVANSNRFSDAKGSVSILDVTGSSGIKPLQSWTAGGFPRNLSLSGDGRTLYLTNYTSRSLQTIQVSREDEVRPRQ